MGPHGEREKISDPGGVSNPRPPEQITVALSGQMGAGVWVIATVIYGNEHVLSEGETSTSLNRNNGY